MSKKIVHISGKRKSSIARATLREGKGEIRINSLNLEHYQPLVAQMRIKEPLMLAGEIASKVDINVNVKGGGWQSQAEAVRLSIARSLLEFSGSKTLKKQFLDYDRHLLVADHRRKETRKPNDSKARAARQKSYR